MKNIMKTFAGKALMAAAAAAISTSAATAALMVDIRAISTSGSGVISDPKSVTAGPGDTVTVGIFLSGLESEVGGTNGLGSFNVSVRSVDAGGQVQATGSTNGQPNPPFDFGYSTGTIADSTIAVDTDTDFDVISISGTQLDGGAPYGVGIGNAQVVLLGTATFTVQPGATGSALNTYFNGSGGTLGGLVIKALTGSTTDDTNGVSSTNLASAVKIGAPVAVAVPEPASMGLLGIAAVGLLRRRRNA